jgi:hypothetical protein
MNVKHAFLISIISTGFLLPAQSYAKAWSYEIEPYLLFTNIEGDASVSRPTGPD